MFEWLIPGRYSVLHVIGALTLALNSLPCRGANDPPQPPEVVNADSFYGKLQAASPSDTISNIIVSDRIDLNRFPRERNIRLLNIHFCGGLKGVPSAPIDMQDGEISTIEGHGTKWEYPLSFNKTIVHQAILDGATFTKSFSCRTCSFIQAKFDKAIFVDAAVFSASRFGKLDAAAAPLCQTPSPPEIASFVETKFSESFFDHVTTNLEAPGSDNRIRFDNAQFAKLAQFSEIDGRFNFSGAAFLDSALFSRCHLNNSTFFSNISSAIFNGVADFSGCTLSGETTFDDVLFRADALFVGNRLSGHLSFKNVLPTHSVDFRGTRTIRGKGVSSDPGTTLVLGPSIAEIARFSWESIDGAVLDGTRSLDDGIEGSEVFDALSANLAARGQTQPSLALAYEARERRRTAGNNRDTDFISDSVERWLWDWPTYGGSEPLRPIKLLLLVGVAIICLGAATGRFALISKGNPDRPHIAVPVDLSDLPDLDGRVIKGRSQSILASAAFAVALLLKYEPRSYRWIRPKSRAAWHLLLSSLSLAWVFGWLLLTMAAAALIASHPTLKAFIP